MKCFDMTFKFIPNCHLRFASLQTPNIKQTNTQFTIRNRKSHTMYNKIHVCFRLSSSPTQHKHTHTPSWDSKVQNQNHKAQY